MLNLLIIMLECVGIIIAVAFVLTRFQFFKNIIDHNHLERKHEIIAIIFFGLFGVMGTSLGFALNISTSQFNTVFDGIVEDEAIANSRVIGVVIAGLLGGYRVGMSAGLIAGLHRMTLGGFTAFSCGLSTIIASMLASAGDFLRILHKETNKQTALKYEDQYRFFPSPSKKQQYKWMNTLESNTNQVSVTLPITLFGSTIAHLYIIEPTDKINQFDQLAMKRCGEILGQFFWKHHQQKEAQQMKKNEWIFEAITGSLTHEEIVSKIQLDLPNIRLQEAMIAVIPVQRSLLRTDSDHVSET
ncbi:MAG TPA: LytS/YhcK type 5TM receptor domain-containing protein, partial [Virgibacillus sp.]|nr:LytS/YhcK type 5TM receptor domain-containing protein [Virgibacillus sp.]